jgi:hypothetical protein
VSEGSDAAWGFTLTLRDRLLGARAALLHHPALIAAAALASLSRGLRALARQFDTSPENIKSILRCRTWKHITHQAKP